MTRVHIPKHVITDQQYDNYWKLTVEYTDIYDLRFNNTLKIIVKYIDDNNLSAKKYEKKHYNNLQQIINKVYDKSDLASVRKSINQFVKLGFVKPMLQGYHELTKKFLNTSNKHEKQMLFSKIFYEASSFNSSVTIDNTKTKQINFLLKTLTYHPDMKLSKNDIIALMVTPNISAISKGYLTKDELLDQFNYAKTINFEEKKYNQISYLIGFLNHMDNIIADKNRGICFKDKSQITIDTVRDPYLYSIYKSELKEQSVDLFGMEVCFLKLKPYKGLICSHIKDSAVCLSEGDLDSAYNPNNGLLLSPEVDAYFDKYDISFNDDGTILINDKIITNSVIQAELQSYSLNSKLLNSERIKYLSWHRNRYEEKKRAS